MDPEIARRWDDPTVTESQPAVQSEAHAPEAHAPDWPARMVDVLFYVGLAGLLLFYLSAALSDAGVNPATVAAALAAAGSLLTVHLRRRRPMVMFTALAITSGLLMLGGELPAWIVLLPPGLFCLSAYDQREWVRRWFVPGVVIALIAWLVAFSEEVLVTVIGSITLLSIIGWANGIRVQRQYRESLLQRIEVVERERDLRAAQAVAAERARIARDIHDLVSHSLAVVAVQAAGAERIADRDPARAKEALGVISGTARDALTEMRGMLEVLRAPEGEKTAAAAPTPGLADLQGLVAGLAARGVPVRLETTGEPYPLAPGAELALYRVVQEALTNAVKHGDQSGAEVTLDYEAEQVVATVGNRVAAPATPGSEIPGSGSGQLGMRERLAIYRGAMTIDHSGEHHRVIVTLPRNEAVWHVKEESP